MSCAPALPQLDCSTRLSPDRSSLKAPLDRYNPAPKFRVAAKFANHNKIVARHGPGNGIHSKGNLGALFVSRKMLTWKNGLFGLHESSES